IGRITTSGSVSEFGIPTPGSFPVGITAGPDGAVWFAERTGNKIGRITTSGSISEFAAPTAQGEPNEITAGPDGALWFIEEAADKVGRITASPTSKDQCQNEGWRDYSQFKNQGQCVKSVNGAGS